LKETSLEEGRVTAPADGRRKQHHRLNLTLGDYVAQLEILVSVSRTDKRRLNDAQHRWINEVASLRKKQRAYGQRANLKTWLEHRALRPLEQPLPI